MERMEPKDFLTFKKMITPAIIQILFWIGAGFCVIGGLIAIVSGASSSYGGGSQVLTGLIVLLFGPIAVRVYCEILILGFRINDTVTEIRNSMPKQ